MIVSLALSPSLDITYEVPALRHGDITRPTAVTRVAGGKALNVARVAHALGADVRVVAALGGHTGAWITEMLTAALVDVDVVQLSAPTRICSAIVEAGENPSSTDLYEPATALSPMEWQRFADAALGRQATDRGHGSSSRDRSLKASSHRTWSHWSRRSVARVLGWQWTVRRGTASSGRPRRSAEDQPRRGGRASGRAAAGRRGRCEPSRRAVRCDAVVTDGVRGGFAVIGGAGCRLEPPRRGTVSGGQRRRLSRRPSCRTRFRARARQGARPGT